jgi:hypothetical protein
VHRCQDIVAAPDSRHPEQHRKLIDGLLHRVMSDGGGDGFAAPGLP